MALTDLCSDVKRSMGITSSDFDSEISEMIHSCFLELDLAGIEVPKNDSFRNVRGLIKQATIFYCKAYMRIDANSPNYLKAFEHLKDAMSLSAEYRRDLSEESGNV